MRKNQRTSAKGEKFIQEAIGDEGALRKHYGLKEGETIDITKARSDLKKLQDQAEGEATLSKKDLELLRQLNLYVNVLYPASQKKKKTSSLREKVIRLAHVKPHLRPHLLPLLVEGRKPRPRQATKKTAWARDALQKSLQAVDSLQENLLSLDASGLVDHQNVTRLLEDLDILQRWLKKQKV